MWNKPIPSSCMAVTTCHHSCTDYQLLCWIVAWHASNFCLASQRTEESVSIIWTRSIEWPTLARQCEANNQCHPHPCQQVSKLSSYLPAPLQTRHSPSPVSVFIFPSTQNTHFVPPVTGKKSSKLWVELLTKLDYSNRAEKQAKRD